VHFTKFGNQYTRRQFLAAAGQTTLGAGMLSPLWDVLSRDGDISRAYPEEALSIEHYSGGAVVPGGVIDVSNVESVKDLLDPVVYLQVSQQGRVIDVKATETDIAQFAPRAYTEATLRNRGRAALDDVGNVRNDDGKRWIGGFPFPDGGSAQEIVAGHSLNWSRHDVAFFPVQELNLGQNDELLYHYHYLFIEYLAAGRTALDPKPFLPGHDETLRFGTFLLTAPQTVKGTSVLNVWNYDQTKLPEFFGFLPDFKRIRRFTSNQRFESSVPASNFYPSDSFMMGDPYLTWSNFKLVGKTPFIAAVADRWWGEKDNWIIDRVGGSSGKRFYRTTMELVPEAYVVDLEPVGYPEAPYSKKRIWFDARNFYPMTMVVFDRKGKILKNYEQGTGLYRMPNSTQWPETGDPYWSWTSAHLHNIQTDTVSAPQQVHEIDGGFKARLNDPAIYEQFCTIPAVRRLGK
jgi:hypothetical protein